MKSQRNRSRKVTATSNALRGRLEALEDRWVPATIGIADATAIEGSTAIRFIDDFVSAGNGGLDDARGNVFGPDGNLYVTSRVTDQVLRYDGATGAFLDVFVASGVGGLDSPWPIVFGPDGHLYVAGNTSHNVVRYHGATGELMDVFVAPGAGGLQFPKGMTFGPDGNLYVSSADNSATSTVPDQVLRFDGTTGAFLDVFVANGSGGLDNPNGLMFGPDGNLYVANTRGDAVNRYNGSTGAFIDAFVASGSGGLDAPNFLVFRPDGLLYVSSQFTHEVLRYSATTGAFVDRLFPAGAGGLDQPFGLSFDPIGNLYLSSSLTSQVLRYGTSSQAAFTVSLDAPSTTPVTVQYGTADGTALAGSDFISANGTVTFSPGQTTSTILIRTLDDTLSEPAETFIVNLSNPVGATIVDGQASGNITDDDATKFYVVNDAATDRTYRYGAPGNAQSVSTLGSGNTAPRGAASNAGGTRVWVVDANKKVYVYDAAGALLGSWTAGSVASNAQIEGIATNGTDIWLVDAKKDKVFKYAGAASRLSGSQNAASSFALSTTFLGLAGNTNPKGIVTDGVSLWVVDDGSTDQVYKYSLSGSSLGHWAIDSANASPTGLTINPANVSDIWIVDSGTDKVYQYTAAAGRTSGSQSAATTFALAAGNANPQDIADPPAISISDATTVEGDRTAHYRGAFVEGNPGGHFNPLTFGPDGLIYTAVGTGDGYNSIRRYDAATGAFIDTFVPAGRINGVRDILFREGFMYVASAYTQEVLRFNAGTGAFVDAFVSVGSGGIEHPDGMAFGPDANSDGVPELYVTGWLSHSVVRYDGTTGQPLGTFVAPGSGGLSYPFALAFGPDGLYVTSAGTNQVLRYDALTGAYLGVAASGGLDYPRGLTIGPDGLLYVTSGNTDRILRFTTAGVYVDDFVPEGAGGMDNPRTPRFGPDGDLYVTATGNAGILRFGNRSEAVFTVSLTSVSTLPVTVSYTTANGTALAGSDYTAAGGTITFAPGQTTRTILVPTLDDALSEGSETFVINLSNPTGATIADGQGAGTIADNEPFLPRVGSVTVNDGVGAQRSRVASITVTFNDTVTFAEPVADAFALSRIGGAAIGSFTATAAVVNGVTVVTLSGFTGTETQFGSLADGRYALTVRASQVPGLDGNGDGVSGDDYTLDGTAANGLYRLYGDATGDGVVNAADFAPFRGAFGSAVGQSAYVEWLDLDGDGFINAFDFAQFRSRFGASVP